MGASDRFLQAFAFLTIFPVTSKQAGTPDKMLLEVAQFFPGVGMLIGLLSGGVYAFASIVWTGLLPALLAVIAGLVATGALHEDGLADTADAFGGGWTREQRLLIMKDSRLGTFGVLALGFSVALRVAALSALSPHITLFALIAAHAGGRFAPVLVMATQEYAGDPDTAKMRYASVRLPMSEVRHALLWTLLAMAPIIEMKPFAAVFGGALGALMAFVLTRYSKSAIGGYCGDVLGAVEQLFEVGFLVGVAAFSARAVS